MRVVLDTHAFLWFVADAPQLSGNAARSSKITQPIPF